MTEILRGADKADDRRSKLFSFAAFNLFTFNVKAAIRMKQKLNWIKKTVIIHEP